METNNPVDAYDAAEIGEIYARLADGGLEQVDQWLRMVAINRLTGHSPGFFSIRTMPPNQAVSAATQRKLNAKHGITPPYRPIKERIVKKSKQLLSDIEDGLRVQLYRRGDQAKFSTALAHQTEMPADSVSLVVTSPPFLDVVQYSQDNWLRCWFAGIDPASVAITMAHRLDEWQDAMTRVLQDCHRVLKPGAHIAFEVGEVHSGKTKLEDHVVPAGIAAGLTPKRILINEQKFTKTANCWGVANNTKGTNTNRIVLFQK